MRKGSAGQSIHACARASPSSCILLPVHHSARSDDFGTMRLFSNGLLSVALAITWLFAVSQAEKTSPAAARFRQAAQSSSTNIAQLSGVQEYESLVSSQRDFSVSLLLTAVDSPPVQCAPCKMFQPTYESIARGFRKIGKKDVLNQHVFTYLEFKNGREVFQKVRRRTEGDVQYAIYAHVQLAF